jgi:hypothetical protein
MTRKSPKDPAFNRMLHHEIEGTRDEERIIFVDTDNRIREAIYPREFESGVLQVARQRLEGLGVLKAIVHVSAEVIGSPTGHGMRTTIIEYLPDEKEYTVIYQPNRFSWANPDELDDGYQKALTKYKHLFGQDEEGEEEQEA